MIAGAGVVFFSYIGFDAVSTHAEETREPQGRNMANWGIALGFVGVFGWLLFAIIGFAFFAPFALWGAGWGWGFDGFDAF